MIETFPQPGTVYASPQRVGLTFWQWCARVIPIVLAIASTSLLAYYFYFDHRGQTELAKQQRQSNSEAADDGGRQPPQDVNPTQQAQAPTPDPQPQPSTPPQPIPADLGPHLPMPSDDVLLMLLYSAVIGLNQANATGNYSVFREMGAPAFQQLNSPEKLAQVFAQLRDQKLDLTPVLLYQPKLLRRPEINAQGMIRITGFFPTSPERVNFELIFQPVQMRWRLFGIAINTSPAPPPDATKASPPPDATKASPSPEQTSKPPAAASEPEATKPTPVKKPKPRAENEGAKPSGIDVRDRIDSPPPSPPPPSAAPKKSIWNPFGG